MGTAGIRTQLMDRPMLFVSPADDFERVASDKYILDGWLE